MSLYSMSLLLNLGHDQKNLKLCCLSRGTCSRPQRSPIREGCRCTPHTSEQPRRVCLQGLNLAQGPLQIGAQLLLCVGNNNKGAANMSSSKQHTHCAPTAPPPHTRHVVYIVHGDFMVERVGEGASRHGGHCGCCCIPTCCTVLSEAQLRKQIRSNMGCTTVALPTVGLQLATLCFHNATLRQVVERPCGCIEVGILFVAPNALNAILWYPAS